MCGIAGIVYQNGQGYVSEETLHGMTATMVYRGPDDEGYYVKRHVGFGFRRLSIIDLETGHQPISNEDGTVWTILNGEIYNFRELRKQLESLGHTFRTHSDSEVLVHLYEEYGIHCVKFLRGMFAFAIYDERADKVFLARDRFGKKPLYYLNDGRRLVFGSELKAILEAGAVSRDVNLRSVALYFTYGYVTGTDSIFSGISKCPPAHSIEFDCATGNLRLQRYWSPDFKPDYSVSELEWKERIRDKLRESVRCRLISDVPLGAFLSGGIDSSSIVAMMSQISDHPVKTFSIGFKEAAYNELEYAREVARMYETDHYEHILDPESVDLLPKLVRAFDEPFSDASAIPTYYVSKLAREHVTVCLSGDGGDELFAGYNYYEKALRIHQYNRLPAAANKLVWGTIHRMLPDWMRGKSLTYFLSQNRTLVPAFFSIFTQFEKNKLFSANFSAQLRNEQPPEAIKQAFLSSCSEKEYLSCLQFLDISTWMVDDVLCKVDRMSMATSLEVRAPLLDHEFAELAFAIPAAYRIRNGSKKYILKEAMKDLLSPNILSHPKQGFGVPLDLWFCQDLKEYMHDRLSMTNHRLSEYLDMAYVQKIIGDHDKKIRDMSYKIWSILVFDSWLEQYT